MHLTCLCPTYGRPSLVRNALALFLAQQLREQDTAHLLIWSDDGLLDTQQAHAGPLSWEVVGTREWIPLTSKYTPMLAHARKGTPSDAWVVWDDDDVYSSWHLYAHASALDSRPWSHPSMAWSTYGGLHARPLGGRHYHGALAIRDDLMQALGGWPITDRSDYDKQQLARCWKQAGPPGDPCHHARPSYVYRWADTQRDHCSARIKDRRYQPPRIQEPFLGVLTPCYDASTPGILQAISI
jgi:hypothetical protein